jgi:DNA modification methylase
LGPETRSVTAARDEEGNILYKDFTHKWADDVWEIGQSSVTKKKSAEYTGYPTQKPEEILKRALEAATDQGDWVLDALPGRGQP